MHEYNAHIQAQTHWEKLTTVTLRSGSAFHTIFITFISSTFVVSYLLHRSGPCGGFALQMLLRYTITPCTASLKGLWLSYEHAWGPTTHLDLDSRRSEREFCYVAVDGMHLVTAASLHTKASIESKLHSNYHASMKLGVLPEKDWRVSGPMQCSTVKQSRLDPVLRDLWFLIDWAIKPPHHIFIKVLTGIPEM